MKPDHQAALAYVGSTKVSGLHESSELGNLAAAYLELRALAQASLDAWAAYGVTGVSEQLWHEAKKADAALREALE